MRDGSRREVHEQETGAAVLRIGGEYDTCRGELEFVRQPCGDGGGEQRTGQMQCGAVRPAYEPFMSHDGGLGDIEYRLEPPTQSLLRYPSRHIGFSRFLTARPPATPLSRATA